MVMPTGPEIGSPAYSTMTAPPVAADLKTPAPSSFRAVKKTISPVGFGVASSGDVNAAASCAAGLMLPMVPFPRGVGGGGGVGSSSLQPVIAIRPRQVPISHRRSGIQGSLLRGGGVYVAGAHTLRKPQQIGFFGK